MRFLLTLVFFASWFAPQCWTQTPLLREASLLEIEDILTGYSDVSSERVTIELETGRTVLLELSFAELPQTKVRAAAMGNDVLLLGYISREFIDPLGFMRAEPPNEDDVWSFEIDGDGDLSYSAVFTPVSKEDMETMVIAHLVLLQMRVQPYLDDLTAVPVEDENAFDVAGCAEGVERAWVGMPQEMVGIQRLGILHLPEGQGLGRPDFDFCNAQSFQPGRKSADRVLLGKFCPKS